MKVLAVDPGEATGFALWHDGDFEASEQTDQFKAAEEVWGYAGMVDEIVCESFQLHLGGRAMTTSGMKTTIELIGMIKWICAADRTPLYFQAPAEAKFSTNDMLNRMGWETPSRPDHMRSAARHLLLRLVKNGTIDGLSLIR